MKNFYYNSFEDENLPFEDHNDTDLSNDHNDNGNYDIRVEEPGDSYNFYPDFGF